MSISIRLIFPLPPENLHCITAPSPLSVANLGVDLSTFEHVLTPPEQNITVQLRQHAYNCNRSVILWKLSVAILEKYRKPRPLPRRRDLHTMEEQLGKYRSHRVQQHSPPAFKISAARPSSAAVLLFFIWTVCLTGGRVSLKWPWDVKKSSKGVVKRTLGIKNTESTP